MISDKLWNWSSPVWIVAVGLLVAYFSLARGYGRAQFACFLMGSVALLMAFVSPVGVLADGYLFSAHMVQHLVLLLVVPLCLLLGFPQQQAREWFQQPFWDRVGRIFSVAAIGWISGVGAMWFWHVPLFCSTAAERPAVGILRDGSLILAGLAFWWLIYAPCERFRLDPLQGIAYLFSACLGCTLLGIYITFTPLMVCPVFANPVDRIGILNMLYDAGLTPGIDQHLGGLMMWVPPCVLYIGAIIGLLCRWYAITEPESSHGSPSAPLSGVAP